MKRGQERTLEEEYRAKGCSKEMGTDRNESWHVANENGDKKQERLSEQGMSEP